MVIGPYMVLVGYGIGGNNITYPPGDFRDTPEYGVVMFAFGTLMGTFCFLVGLVRLVQNLRSRRRR